MVFFTKKENSLFRSGFFLLFSLLLIGSVYLFWAQKNLIDFIPEGATIALRPLDAPLLSDRSAALYADLVLLSAALNPKNTWLVKAPLSAQEQGWLLLWEKGKSAVPTTVLQLWDAKLEKTTLYHNTTFYHWRSARNGTYCLALIGNKGLLSHSPLLVEEAIRTSEQSQHVFWRKWLNNNPPTQKDITLSYPESDTGGFFGLFSGIRFHLSKEGKWEGAAQLKSSLKPWPSQETAPWSVLAKNIPQNLSWLFPLFFDPLHLEPETAKCWKKYFTPWIKGQPVLGAFNLAPDEIVMVVPWKDPDLMKRSIQEYIVANGQLQRYDYQTFTILQVFDARLSSLFIPFGLKKKANLSFTEADGCLLLGTSPAAIEQWIDAFVIGNVCSQTSSPFQTQSGSKAFFRYPHQQGQFLVDALDLVKGKTQARADFYLEGDLQNDTWYFGLNTKKWTPEQQPSIIRAWQTEMVAAPARQLYLLDDWKGSSIGVQTADHRFHLLDDKGKVAWSKPLEGSVLGTPQFLSYFDDGEKQILFNTTQQVHCLDKKGQEVPGFPFLLRVPATTGLTLTKDDFHYFIPANNGRVYAFDRKNLPLPGWNPGPMVGNLRFPVQFAQSQGQDYVFLLNEAGLLSVADRAGVLHFPALSFTPPIVSPFGIQWEDQIQRIVLLDGSLKFAAIDHTGAFFRLPTGLTPSKAGANMLFADVIGDERKDYLAMSNQEFTLHYYDEKGAFVTAVQRKLPQLMDTIFTTPLVSGEKLIGFSSKRAQQLYLMDRRGAMAPGFPIAADMGGVLGSKKLLVTIFDGKVYAYWLESLR